MKLPAFRVLLLVGVLSSGTCMIADESRRNGLCSGVDSRHGCVHLGELSDSVLLAGIFKSCTESGFSMPLGSEEDPASSAVYQFNLTRAGVVKLDIDGLGDALVLKQDTLVFRADGNLPSIQRRFEPGRYTLIGRAPRCRNGKADWNGGYKIQIDPHGAEESNARETVDVTGEVVVLTRQERESILRRTFRWSFTVTMAAAGIVLLILLSSAIH